MEVLVSLSLMYHRLLGEFKGTRIKFFNLSCFGKLLFFFFFFFFFGNNFCLFCFPGGVWNEFFSKGRH